MSSRGSPPSNVRTFCAGAGIEICDARGANCVTASFREEENNDLERLVHHASQSDLVVMGRAAQKQGLSPYTLESLVRTCGRPILVAATTAPRTLTDTIMVCWKDSASTGGVVTVAAPLLAAARRVVFVSVAKRDDGLADAMAPGRTTGRRNRRRGARRPTGSPAHPGGALGRRRGVRRRPRGHGCLRPFADSRGRLRESNRRAARAPRQARPAHALTRRAKSRPPRPTPRATPAV